MRPISFAIEKELPGSQARAGVLTTPHGDIETPAFIAVSTKANVKGIPASEFKALGVQGTISNTYHLYLSGLDAIEKAGGVGTFMNWGGPTMTDSGGFQVFSLGVGFGKKVSKFLSPEISENKDAGILNQATGHESASPKEREEKSPSPVFWDEDLATTHGKLAIVDEEGVSFSSHIDGTLHRFTPERSIEIQHNRG